MPCWSRCFELIDLNSNNHLLQQTYAEQYLWMHNKILCNRYFGCYIGYFYMLYLYMHVYVCYIYAYIHIHFSPLFFIWNFITRQISVCVLLLEPEFPGPTWGINKVENYAVILTKDDSGQTGPHSVWIWEKEFNFWEKLLVLFSTE